MRNLVLAFAATILIAACGKSSEPGATAPVSTTISCFWGTTCDQYSGTIDSTFAANLETTCQQHGTAFAQSACPAADQVAGHCDFGTSNGMSSSYYYYAPTYDAASAQEDCVSPVIGVQWVP